MCGRTSLFVPQWLLEDRFEATAVDRIEPRYNLAPGDDLAVVTNEATDEIRSLEWGLVPGWADDPDDPELPHPINARAERVTESGMFRAAFESRRCLVLADGFYEWRGDRGAKQPYRIVRRDNQPFAMAGLWERWEPDDAGADDVATAGDGGRTGGRGTRETVTVITTEPNRVVSRLHDRMPVVLEPDEESTWLADAEADVHRDLLDPAPEDLLRSYPVSTRVNDPSNDDPDVVRAVRRAESEQSGLGDFAA